MLKTTKKSGTQDLPGYCYTFEARGPGPVTKGGHINHMTVDKPILMNFTEL